MMGTSPPERPEQKESKRRGPEAGTNLEETNEGQSGWNTKGECGRTDEVARTRSCGVSQDKAWYLEFILSPVRITE